MTDPIQQDALLDILPPDSLDILPPTAPEANTGGPETVAKTALLGAMAQVKFGNLTTAQINAAAEAMAAEISQGGEGDVRKRISDSAQAKVEQKMLELARAQYFSGDSAGLQELFAPNGVWEAAQTINERDNPFALERAGVEGIQDEALKHPIQVQVAENTNPDLDAKVAEWHKKQAIWQNLLDKVNEKYKSQGVLTKALNYAGLMVPFHLLTSEFAEDTSPSLFSGSTLEAQRRHFLDMPLEEFMQKAPAFAEQAGRSIVGETNTVLQKIAIENMLRGMGENQQLAHSMLSVWDATDAGAIAHWASSLRNGFRFTKGLDRAGTEQRLAETIELAANGTPPSGVSGVVHDVNAATEASLTSTLARTSDPSVGLSGGVARGIEAAHQLDAEVAAALKEQREAAMEVISDRVTTINTPEERAAAFEATRKKVETELYKGSHIEDVRLNPPDKVSGVPTYTVTLGRAKGTGGYATEKQALNAAKKRGIGGAKTIQDPSGQWFINVTHVLPEEGYIIPSATAEIKATNTWTAKATNILGWLPKRMGVDLQIAVAQKARMNKLIREQFTPYLLQPVLDPIRNKKIKEWRRNVIKVLQKGDAHVWTGPDGRMQEGKWFNSQELDTQFQIIAGRLPTKEEKLGYYTYKNINDLDWAIRNTREYQHLSRLGYSHLTIEGLNYSSPAKEILSIPQADNLRIFDAVNNRYLQPGDISAEALKKRMDEGSRLFLLRTPIKVGDDPVTLVLGKGGSVSVSQLNPIVIGYRQGGHRIYEGKYFVKQANFGTYQDGKKWKGSAFVHAVFESVKEASEWAAEHEEARLAVRAFKAEGSDANRVAMEEALAAIEIDSLDEWNRMVLEGAFSETHPFRAVYDRELPVEYSEGVSDFFDISNKEAFTDDTAAWLVHTNKAYTGKRGTRLLGSQDKEARVLDPFEAQDRSLRNAIRMHAMGDFYVSAMEEWVAMAKALDALDPDSLRTGGNVAQIFNEARYTRAATDPDIAKLENLRQVLKNKIGKTTAEDEMHTGMRRRLAEFVEDKTGISASSAYDWVSADKYLSAMRGWAFDVYLGFGNPGQFLFQLSTALGIAAMKLDIRALSGAMTLRTAMANPKIEKQLAIKWKALHGLSEEEFTGMMQDLRKSGFANVADAGLYMEGSYMSRARQAGRRPVYEAEILNRLTAWHVAYREALKKGFKPGSREIFRDVLDRAGALSMDMGEASRSMAVKGTGGSLLASALQFQQYALHTAQNLLGAGGLSRWTPEERWRFAVGQLALWGSAAAPWGEDIMNYFVEKYEETSDKETSRLTYKALQTGMVDALIYWASDGEMDTAMGARAGFGTGITRALGDAWTRESPPQIILGPTYNMMNDFSKSLLNVYQYISISKHPDVLPENALWEAVMDMARNIGSVREVEKALTIYRKGLLISRRGEPVAYAPKLQALASILGFPSGKQHDLALLFAESGSFNTDVETLTKMVNENNARAAMEETVEGQQFWAIKNAALLEGESPEVQRRVFQKARDGLTETMYNSMAKARWKQDHRLSPLIRYNIEASRKDFEEYKKTLNEKGQ
jgi:hypothetical protein